MRIGIDISQLAYEGTGVANYLKNLVLSLLETDHQNEYVLFYSSLRRKFKTQSLKLKTTTQNVKVKEFYLPPSLLDMLWNRLHIIPIENFIGDVDIFITSDWTEPPTKRAKKVTILYDLIVYKYPEESHNQTHLSLKGMILKPNIVAAQKRKHKWAKKEVDKFLCISESTKKDAIEILGLLEENIEVIYPGIAL